MSDLQGLFYPRTPTGKASIVPPVPWHYSGELITLEYRTDPARIAALLPAGFSLADEDPGAVAAIWADWQSTGDDPAQLLDPVRVQYKEMFIVVRCKFQGRTWSRCVYIWVDKEFAMLRGIHQGYPKKLGSIHMSRPVVVGKAGPRLAPGGTFGVTLAANDRRLAEGRFTITGAADKPGFVNGLPMAHNRWLPAIETDGTQSLDEVVTMSGFDVDASPATSTLAISLRRSRNCSISPRRKKSPDTGTKSACRGAQAPRWRATLWPECARDGRRGVTRSARRAHQAAGG